MAKRKAAAIPFAALCAVFCVLASAARAQQPPQPGPSSADALLASRMSDMGRARLAVRVPQEPEFRQCASLLRAAMRLDPAHARYPRLLADSLLKVSDRDGAIEALVAYRKIKPMDESAQLELIELYLDRLETVEKKLSYLNELRGNATVPPSVKSVIALRAARLLLEQGDDAQARLALDQSLSLDPLNGTAWQLRLETLPENDYAGRLSAMLGLIRADPAQPEVLLAVGRELGEAGLTTDSLRWYAYALTTGARDPEGVLLEYAAQLVIAGQTPEAKKRLDALVAAGSENYPAFVMRLLLARADEEKDLVPRLSVQAKNILLNRLATVRKSLGVATATTQPVNAGAAALPPLEDDVALWKASQDQQLRDSYLNAVGDLAWFEVYINQQPDESEKLLNHFSLMADESNVFAARTAGWILLARDRKDEARVKLSAVADRDPLAAVGLVRLIAPEEKEKAQAEAAKILASQPSGVMGAILADALRSTAAAPATSPRGQSLSQVLKAFPLEWLNILQYPKQFYIVRAEPLKVSHEFGELLSIRVSIQNIGRHDLRIAADGVVKPGLWLEVQGQGLFRSLPTMYLYDRLTEQLVLKPRQSLTLLTRLDDPDLLRFLEVNAVPAVPMNVVVRTNPAMAANKPISMPGGYASNLLRPLERGSSPFNSTTLQRAMEQLRGSGAEQMLAMELLAAFHRLIMTSQQRTPDTEEADKKVREAIAQARADDELPVRAWASLLYAVGSGEEEIAPAIQRMFLDEAWPTRLLGLVVVRSLPADRAIRMTQDIAERDPDPIVKEHARWTLEVLRQPPATQPTQPAPK